MINRVAGENHLAKVTGVRLRIGRFSGVQPEALRFAWEVLSKGTNLETAALEMEEVPIHLRCRQCESEYAADPDDLSCPLCESLEYDLLSGREMDLQSVMGEVEENV